MQCKVLKFGCGTDPMRIETEINRWLAQGWKIVSTTSADIHGRDIFVFLTK